jgi:RNA polymerase sigma factor for flagellar operon FliA
VIEGAAANGEEPMHPAIVEVPAARHAESEIEQLVLEQMPQVKYIARRIHERLPQHVPFEDLMQAGMVGLMDALNKFDCEKKVKFASYAKFRIRGAILDSLRELDWSPRDLRRKSRQINMVTQKLQTELGRAASEPELAEALGLSLEEFQDLTKEIRGLEIASLQSEHSEDGQESDLAESLPGREDEDPLTLCEQHEMNGQLQRAIIHLPEREQQVLMLYYQQEMTMREVGELMGIGESRVSQIHSQAVKRLRELM